MRLKAVLFDFIGTTILEKTPDIISTCFEEAFKENDMRVTRDFIQVNRGKNKREVIEQAVQSHGLPAERIDKVLLSFGKIIERNLSHFSIAPRAMETFDHLRGEGVKLGIGTGLTRESFEKILAHVKWKAKDFDYTATAEEIGKGRPHPDMIFDMMKKLQFTNPKEFLKIGDTVADIQEGKNAGVWTAVVLSGTQKRKLLEKEKPDFVLTRLGELIEW